MFKAVWVTVLLLWHSIFLRTELPDTSVVALSLSTSTWRPPATALLSIRTAAVLLFTRGLPPTLLPGQPCVAVPPTSTGLASFCTCRLPFTWVPQTVPCGRPAVRLWICRFPPIAALGPRVKTLAWEICTLPPTLAEGSRTRLPPFSVTLPWTAQASTKLPPFTVTFPSILQLAANMQFWPVDTVTSPSNVPL